MASDEPSSAAAPTTVAPPTASSPSSSSSAGDSYIGNLISLTSKCEIRYEGILAAINPQESTIALQNVRSYGTEGRKRDGPQIPPSNHLYEYILFRGTDIKDLQVKSSSTSHTKPQMDNDPAIIQSHYDHASASYPPAVSSGGGAHAYPPAVSSGGGTLVNTPAVSSGGGTLAGTGSYAAQSSVGNLPYPDAYSMYQTGGRPGSSVSPSLPISTNGASITAPAYFQEYANTSRSQSHAQQHSSTVQPPPVMQQNQLQHLGGHAPTSMPTLSGQAAPLSLSLTATPSQHSNSNPDDLSLPQSSTSSFLFRPSSSFPSHLPTMSSFSSYNQDFNITTDPIHSKAGFTAPPVFPASSLPYSSSLIGGSALRPVTTSHLLTPDQFTKSAPPEFPSHQKLYPEQTDMGALLPSSSSNPAHSVEVLSPAPLLPLPQPSQQGPQLAGFNEEFDFTTMNEKFKKDEVWGSLGKTNQRGSHGTEGDLIHGNVGFEGGYEQDPRFRNKPVYNKDDFFDTLSCNSLNRGGRTRFSDRMRLDTETFGGFQQRPPVGRGYYGPPSNGNFRGSYNQRGRGYGYYGGRGYGGHGPFY